MGHPYNRMIVPKLCMLKKLYGLWKMFTVCYQVKIKRQIKRQNTNCIEHDHNHVEKCMQRKKSLKEIH